MLEPCGLTLDPRWSHDATTIRNPPAWSQGIRDDHDDDHGPSWTRRSIRDPDIIIDTTKKLKKIIELFLSFKILNIILSRSNEKILNIKYLRFKIFKNNY